MSRSSIRITLFALVAILLFGAALAGPHAKRLGAEFYQDRDLVFPLVQRLGVASSVLAQHNHHIGGFQIFGGAGNQRMLGMK